MAGVGHAIALEAGGILMELNGTKQMRYAKEGTKNRGFVCMSTNAKRLFDER